MLVLTHAYPVRYNYSREHSMLIQDPKTVDPGSPEKKSKNAETYAGTGGDNSCRCKEASKMSPHQLLRLMINDLKFWKKEQKE